MQYIAYGSQRSKVDVSYREGVACVRMTGDYTAPADPETDCGSWKEAYGEFAEAPVPELIEDNWDEWWAACADWQEGDSLSTLETRVKTLEANMENVVAGLEALANG